MRHGGVSVVAEIGRLSMIASRRLQLAAEHAGRPIIALRRYRRASDITDFGGPTAAATRWRIKPYLRPHCQYPALAAPGGGWS